MHHSQRLSGQGGRLHLFRQVSSEALQTGKQWQPLIKFDQPTKHPNNKFIHPTIRPHINMTATRSFAATFRASIVLVAVAAGIATGPVRAASSSAANGPTDKPGEEDLIPCPDVYDPVRCVIVDPATGAAVPGSGTVFDNSCLARGAGFESCSPLVPTSGGAVGAATAPLRGSRYSLPEEEEEKEEEATVGDPATDGSRTELASQVSASNDDSSDGSGGVRAAAGGTALGIAALAVAPVVAAALL